MFLFLVQLISTNLMLATLGTLVVVIPTRDGLVVAADSRSTVLGMHYDGVVKLEVASTDSPILVTITGNSDFADPPPPGATLQDWMPRATYQYQGTEFVLSYLSKRSALVVSEASLVDTANALAESLQEFLKSKPLVAASFSEKELCRLVLCQASSQGRRQIFGSAVLRVGKTGNVSVQSHLVKVYRGTDAKSLELAGEGQYFIDHVQGGAGRRFFSEESASIWNKRARVKDFNATDAARLATAIIKAAESTTAIVPVPSGHGIGGAVHVYLVTPKRVSSLGAK